MYTSVPSSQSYTGQQAGKSALGSAPSLTRLHPGVASRSTTGPQSVTSSARRPKDNSEVSIHVTTCQKPFSLPDSSLTHLEAPQKGARDQPSPGRWTLHWVDAKQLSLKSEKWFVVYLRRNPVFFLSKSQKIDLDINSSSIRLNR